MAEVLFEITKDQLETGLRGFPVGYCTTSAVDPTKGLSYIGRPIADLAAHDPVYVIYLLLNGREGSDTELKAFADELKKRSTCSPDLIKQIRQLPRKGHPMKL